MIDGQRRVVRPGNWLTAASGIIVSCLCAYRGACRRGTLPVLASALVKVLRAELLLAVLAVAVACCASPSGAREVALADVLRWTEIVRCDRRRNGSRRRI